MIVVIDSVFTQQECDYLISLYAEYKDKAHEWADTGTRPLDFKFTPKELSFGFIEKVQSTVNSIFKEVEYNWGEIVKWDTFTGQNFHLDTSFQNWETTLTSITYLNNNFSGGKTVFSDGTMVCPVVGRTLIFDGNKYYHGVEQVSEGIRWTMPIWYKKRIT
jgi:hypothetical protein